MTNFWVSVAIASYLYPILHVWYSRDYAKSNLTTGTTGHIVVCVSPLTALMMDQRDKFQARGVAAFPFSFNLLLSVRNATGRRSKGSSSYALHLD